MQELTVQLPSETILALQALADETDNTVGSLIREAITRDLRRRAEAKTPNRADEQLVAPLRALLAHDFAYATSWQDLQQRLAIKGYRIAESGGGIVLQRHQDGSRICKGSELGYSYALLMRKFKVPLPGHSHRWPGRHNQANH